MSCRLSGLLPVILTLIGRLARMFHELENHAGHRLFENG